MDNVINNIMNIVMNNVMKSDNSITATAWSTLRGSVSRFLHTCLVLSSHLHVVIEETHLSTIPTHRGGVSQAFLIHV